MWKTGWSYQKTSQPAPKDVSLVKVTSRRTRCLGDADYDHKFNPDTTVAGKGVDRLRLAKRLPYYSHPISKIARHRISKKGEVEFMVEYGAHAGIQTPQDEWLRFDGPGRPAVMAYYRGLPTAEVDQLDNIIQAPNLLPISRSLSTLKVIASELADNVSIEFSKALEAVARNHEIKNEAPGAYHSLGPFSCKADVFLLLFKQVHGGATMQRYV